jgi:hypothetical protein
MRSLFFWRLGLIFALSTAILGSWLPVQAASSTANSLLNLSPEPTASSTAATTEFKAEKIVVGDQQFAILDSDTPITVKNDTSWTIKGTASPFARISLTIHDEALLLDAVADRKGAWALLVEPAITKQLAAGKHEITAHTSSDPREASLATINLKEQNTAAGVAFTSIPAPLWWFIIGAVLIIAAGFPSMLLMSRKKKLPQAPSPSQ